MAELAGALLGAVVSELLRAVIHGKNTLISFKPSLEQLSSTLELVISKVEEMKGIDQIDDRPEIRKLISILQEGISLVEKCASVKSWNHYLKHRYSKKILELDNYLRRFFQMDVQAAIWCDVLQVLGKVTHFDHKLDLLTKEIGTSSDSINDGPGDGAADGDQGVHDPVELGKESTSSFHLVNRLKPYVAFKKRREMTTIGTLEVLLLNAYKLKDTDIIGKMDPYVIIQFGNQKRKSAVAHGEGKQPVWNEKFKFDVEYPDNIRDEHHPYKLNLTIMDKDWFSRDDYVGESTINLTDVLSLGVRNGTSEVRTSKYRVVLHNKTYSGEIRVGISFTRKDKCR